MSLQLEILRAIAALQPNAYGLTIRDRICENTGCDYSFGRLYDEFETLEDGGLIQSREGEATEARGWRKKLYFDLTPIGRRKLEVVGAQP